MNLKGAIKTTRADSRIGKPVTNAQKANLFREINPLFDKLTALFDLEGHPEL